VLSSLSIYTPFYIVFFFLLCLFFFFIYATLHTLSFFLLRLMCWFWFWVSSVHNSVLSACSTVRVASGPKSCVRHGVVHASVACQCWRHIGRRKTAVDGRIRTSQFVIEKTIFENVCITKCLFRYKLYITKRLFQNINFVSQTFFFCNSFHTSHFLLRNQYFIIYFRNLIFENTQPLFL